VTKRCNESMSQPDKMHQIVWRPGLRPGPYWGSLQRSPRPPSWIYGGAASRRGEGRGGEELSPPNLQNRSTPMRRERSYRAAASAQALLDVSPSAAADGQDKRSNRIIAVAVIGGPLRIKSSATNNRGCLWRTDSISSARIYREYNANKSIQLS
jgi:hypothetical protein